MLKKIYFLLFILATIGYSQELPPIIKYTAAGYNGGNQNWMISQDSNRFMYFANNEGLLEFNGTAWTLYPSPNETIMRSVRVIGKRIYTGCYMEFGYWYRQATGVLKYHSLSKSLKGKILDDEQFWNIAQYDHWVIFQSLNQIFIYDTTKGTYKIVAPKSGVNKVFTVNNTILYQTFTTGLYEIENGTSRLVSNDPAILNNKIVNIFSKNDALLLQTQFNGFYKLNGKTAVKWNTAADADLLNNSIYSSQMLSDGSIALGSVSNGLYILSSGGGIRYHITQNKGLSNNTALTLFEDKDNNLWLGLDNGINCINLKSAVRSFTDDTGFLGTVYASMLHNGMLYIGTNQGLFYKNYNSTDSFKLVPGTKGQVWSLYKYDGALFCGHDYGTFVIAGESANHIYSASGTWKFESHPENPNLLLQGNYHGISVLENKGGNWQFRNKIQGFDYSSRYFETAGRDIYVSHEYKGVFRITSNTTYTTITERSTYTSPAKGKNSSLAKFNNAIFYASKDGFFKLEPKSKKFIKQNALTRVLRNDEYTSGKLIPDNAGKLWFFTKNYINYFSSGKLSSTLKHNLIPIPSALTNSMAGYENINALTPVTYLVGTTDGYYTLTTSGMQYNKYAITITGAYSGELNKEQGAHSLKNESSYNYDSNNLSFLYTVPEYNKYVNVDYQYKLKGIQDEWSEWNGKSSVAFKNLPSGDYTFQVRAKTGNVQSINTASYTFIILKPWYATHIAVFIYFILAIICAYLINKAYNRYYEKQKEKLIEENNRLLEIKELENEQELMKFKNEQLQQEFESKNKELAVSTMNLIKKNELLSLIKDDLKKTGEGTGDKNIKSVITTINKNINEDDTWDMFKEAFNNADKDFLKKVKKAHPVLTPNDLRLCAYLRLNLSSKEIAPLLNISVRSVEIKRYRLRKKMELAHELGLVEYILSI